MFTTPTDYTPSWVRRGNFGQPLAVSLANAYTGKVETSAFDTPPPYVLRFIRAYRSSSTSAVHTVMATYGAILGASSAAVEKVLLNPANQLSCTCIGFKTGKKCKHSTALAFLLRTRALDIARLFVERPEAEMRRLAKPEDDYKAYAAVSVFNLDSVVAGTLRTYEYNKGGADDRLISMTLVEDDAALGNLITAKVAQADQLRGFHSTGMSPADDTEKKLENTIRQILTNAYVTNGLPAVPAPVPVVPVVQYAPMLASASKQPFEVYTNTSWSMEEKFDGHRLLVRVFNGTVRAKSRPGASHGATDRALPPHIVAEFAKFTDGIYDGELYLPGGTSTDVVRLDIQDKLRFVVFDILRNAECDVMSENYLVRRHNLGEIFWLADPVEKHVHMAARMPVGWGMLEKIWIEGGEGVILKHHDSIYLPGERSASWIKIKKEDSSEVTITGFEKGKLGPNSVALFRDKNGNDSKVKVLNSDILADVDKRRDEYIGKTLVIAHKGLTSGGLFRHPVWDHVLWS